MLNAYRSLGCARHWTGADRYYFDDRRGARQGYRLGRHRYERELCLQGFTHCTGEAIDNIVVMKYTGSRTPEFSLVVLTGKFSI